MKQFRLSIVIITFFFSLFSGVAIGADEPSASEELQALLRQAQSLSGSFEQKLYDRDGHLLQTTEGTFAVQRPGNFYWETLPPYEQLVVGNSDTLWVYDPDLEQVTVHKQAQRQQSSPARLLSGELENLDKHYQVTQEQKGAVQQFNLISTGDNGAFARLQLKYRDSQLAGLSFEDNMGQVTELSFANIEVNPTLDPKLFQFEAPEGVDVIVDD